MRRRRVLTTAGLGVATLVAGCNRSDERTTTPRGQWELDGRVVNEDDTPRGWSIEGRTESGSVVAASGTIPGAETWEFGLSGRLRVGKLEVYASSDTGATTAPWRPTDCPQFVAVVTISGGRPSLELRCADGE